VQTDVLERRTASVEHADYILQAVDTHRSGEAGAFLGRTRRPLGRGTERAVEFKLDPWAAEVGMEDKPTIDMSVAVRN
jgi:hypothetical protein